MHYLHTMLRVSNLDASIDFFCNILGFVQISRSDYEKGRFSLVFLAAPGDEAQAHAGKSPLLELTYNWPDQEGEARQYTGGDNFGHLAYRVENIYTYCQQLVEHGVTIHRPPRDGHMAFIKTPDGISIELLQQGDPLPPQEPWVSMQNQGSW